MRARQAFTLVELLMVITIITILAALLLPTLENALAQSRAMACANNQHQLSLAMVQYSDLWNGAIAKECFNQDAYTYTNTILRRNLSVGDPSAVYHHGAWMADNLALPECYFCPDPTWENDLAGTGYGTIQEHREAFTSYMRPLFASGGMSWPAKANTNMGGTRGVNYVWVTNYVSYALNTMLVPDNSLGHDTWGFGWQASQMVKAEGAGWRYAEAKPGFPLLADARSISYTPTYHGGRGFNVCYLDGAVAFRSTSQIIAAGIKNNIGATTTGRNYQLYWQGYTRMPDDPRDDPERVASAYGDAMWTTPYAGERFGRLFQTFFFMRK